jgi:hypothetical protein
VLEAAVRLDSCAVEEDMPTALGRLELYIELMSEWVEAAERGDQLDDLAPVGVPPSPEHIAMLRSRVETLSKSIAPWFRRR